ncbi:hypothetical protein E3N88_01243 [Mikania micrantha]|uniref:dCTP pyrophosphatase 1 n=1 Tax=Mikania micrantha TaxID=192012 RepID=A0A5N6Q1W7_9ASTR|nr:hypothetical protein E3N88_01243 [Mikania micrantha]
MTTPADRQDDVSLSELKKKMADFAKERDWDQFHSPRNLLLALVLFRSYSMVLFALLTVRSNSRYIYTLYDSNDMDCIERFVVYVSQIDFECRINCVEDESPFFGMDYLGEGYDQWTTVVRHFSAAEKKTLHGKTSPVGEVGELSEIFQWKGEVPRGLPGWEDEEKQHLGEELSDVLLYLVRLSDICDVDLGKAVLRKLELNATKYPVKLCKGSSKKHSQLINNSLSPPPPTSSSSNIKDGASHDGV